LHNSKMDFHAINEIPEKLEPLTNYQKVKLIEPGYTDLDLNFHVNAGKYIAWIQDLYPPDFYRNFQISEFQINYLNETRFGSKVQIFSFEEPAGETLFTNIEGRIEGKDTPAFRAHIGWSKTAT
jgi:medium-chain acyl-[acyl-carrier-protein] hydrolase